MKSPSPSHKIHRRQLKALARDPSKAAEAVRLVYVSDAQEGIRRVKRGKYFSYLVGEQRLKDERILKRIRSLVIPPAWENVWICKLDNGHLQATGLDAKKRKQYRYHTLWNAVRNHTKFHKLLDFGQCMPQIRLRLEADLQKSGLSQEKVLATVTCLLEQTSIRIGNELYEKLNGSFGLTTLKDKHVKIEGPTMKFVFKGKKGVQHNITLRNKRLAHIVRQCRDIPGKELFQYIGEDGDYHTIDSGMVNEYIREISGNNFSAKDFRTWAGTVKALDAFRELGAWESEHQKKKRINEALDFVAAHLGNTRTVCKKYYVHPTVLELYDSGQLQDYFTEAATSSDKGLQPQEQVLLSILAANRGVVRLTG